MHIWSNLKDYLYDNNDFIAFFNNRIYLYNFINIDKLTNNNIIICFNKYKIEINGKNLNVLQCKEKEIIISGIIESVSNI